MGSATALLPHSSAPRTGPWPASLRWGQLSPTGPYSGLHPHWLFFYQEEGARAGFVGDVLTSHLPPPSEPPQRGKGKGAPEGWDAPPPQGF